MVRARTVTDQLDEAVEMAADTAVGAADVAITSLHHPSRSARRTARSSHRRGAGATAAVVRGGETLNRPGFYGDYFLLLSA